MEKRQIMALIANVFVKGAASTIVVNKSADTAMNKGRGANRNPFMGRVIIAKEYCGYVMGTDYAQSLENTADRMGNGGAEASRFADNSRCAWYYAQAGINVHGGFVVTF